MSEFSNKIIMLDELERKIGLYQNTARTVYENLRITKLKQENLELLILN
jgi:hypothetical protein